VTRPTVEAVVREPTEWGIRLRLIREPNHALLASLSSSRADAVELRVASLAFGEKERHDVRRDDD